MWDILLHIFLIVFLPLIFAAGLFRGGINQWEWWSGLALAFAVTGWSFVIGRWDMAGYAFRFLPPVLTVVAAVAGWRRIRRGGGKLARGTVRSFSVVLNLVLAFVFVVQIGVGVAGFFSDESAIELAFPLHDGKYYVVQGGSTVMINYHAAYPPQAYALDISRLNRFGYRAAGVYPSELNQYAIFGVPVYSPCTGEVIAARDGLPDYTPPERDPERPEGNFVAIHCQGVDIFLAHMQEHSVLVGEGDSVVMGQPLGKVGNSGNTTEPHLHIHAARRVDLPDGGGEGTGDGTGEGVGVPMRFNGRFLGRNRVVVGR